jgi:hypothetical protein
VRTSFHHQSEAQPPNGTLTAATSPDTPSHMPSHAVGSVWAIVWVVELCATAARQRMPALAFSATPQASLPRSWPTPELRIPNAAAQTRIVSKARIRLDSRKSMRSFKEIYDELLAESLREPSPHESRDNIGRAPRSRGGDE